MLDSLEMIKKMRISSRSFGKCKTLNRKQGETPRETEEITIKMRETISET